MALKLLTKKDKLRNDLPLSRVRARLTKAKYKQSREKSLTERWYACESNPLVTIYGGKYE
jgi:hypothetical protein